MNLQKLLALSALTYIVTCIYYMINTRSLGTPFKDAVAKVPELQKIKDNSVKVRKKIFKNGLIFSIILVLLINPF